MGRETQGGQWIKRDADIHRCPFPPYDSTVRRGDEWQCGACRTIWVVNSLDSGMQWDPINPPRIVWKRKPPSEPGIYAPGTK